MEKHIKNRENFFKALGKSISNQGKGRKEEKMHKSRTSKHTKMRKKYKNKFKYIASHYHCK